MQDNLLGASKTHLPEKNKISNVATGHSHCAKSVLSAAFDCL